MNKLFTENLPWKIAAFVIASVLWLFVINTQNPTQPQEIAGIRVRIVGKDTLTQEDYELTNEQEILNQNFKVVVSGPRLEVDELVRNPDKIVATLDLSDYGERLTGYPISDPNIQYKVSINLQGSSVVIKDVKPQVTEIFMDKISSKEQKVTYTISEDITNKYQLIGDKKPVISPDRIEITGPKSLLDKVAEARVDIKEGNFSPEQLVSQLPIRIYDIDGTEITGLQLETDIAEVKLPIGAQKIVPIHINYTGEVPEGYLLTDVKSDLSTVTIIGKAEVLEGISEIQLQPIDLSNRTEDDMVQVEMILPDGIMSLEDKTVSVSLQIRGEKTLNYPVLMSELNLSVEGIGKGLTFEILTDAIDVELSGLSDDLITTDKSDLKATLDLSHYAEGEYTLPLTITAPDKIKVKNSPISIKVRIKALEEDLPSISPDHDITEGQDSEIAEETEPDTTP